MNLSDFLQRFDIPGAVVLLEGKRNVLPEDQDKLIALGKLLAERTTHLLFRSGNASGSDYLFSEGVAAIAKKRLQVITPYTGHRQQTNNAYETIALDTLDLAAEPDLIYQSKNNKKTETLIDRYVAGDKNPYTIKAAYIIRDTVKVLGANGIPPANFGIFYDDLQDPMNGGTGHTMRVCRQNNIPMVDQTIWMEWLDS